MVTGSSIEKYNRLKHSDVEDPKEKRAPTFNLGVAVCPF